MVVKRDWWPAVCGVLLVSLAGLWCLEVWSSLFVVVVIVLKDNYRILLFSARPQHEVSMLL